MSMQIFIFANITRKRRIQKEIYLDFMCILYTCFSIHFSKINIKIRGLLDITIYLVEFDSRTNLEVRSVSGNQNFGNISCTLL